MRMAKEISTWSKDDKHKVGAVIVDPFNRVVSTGYNGPPRGTSENCGRDVLRHRSLHAELNAILFSGQSELYDCKIYIYPHAPCAQCAAAIVQVGISEVSYLKEKPQALLTSWSSSQLAAKDIFDEADVFYYEIEDMD